MRPLWRPAGLAKRVLDRQPEPELLRLQLLHDLDRLNPEEMRRLEALEGTEFESQVSMLKLSYPEGSDTDP